ncbi:DUF4198 domain-containing protein [Oceanidesulfovibrio marinus]|uniref:DUF4198 domain-containing protein n=1 Tax=Oceanidesulfovibrio marinus TaxID=370038 RepID=A0A6P1ZI31_9BACT|nr:DUF4198 domain-containing protein [Oceanidesulfovibrio marinus]QJT07807.1 DUF4198 domain-containing protein [Oceanidesulfovibrio marinus]TVM33306.1 DUF4198 domain-containing protein [Oceanidesulfovibrio marinus]
MRFNRLVLAAFFLLIMSAPAFAHFGMVIPSQPVVTPDNRSVDVTLSFSHPFGGEGMNLVKPKEFGVVFEGEKTDLLGSLKEATVMEHPAWTVHYDVKRPGVYTFYMEPVPYWEPAEDCSIIHYTKAVVPAFGGEDGWDEPLGLKTEIVPLLRPFGNYAGNAFVGQVLLDGKPVPNAEVEVELYNQAGFSLPSDYHETQVVKADGAGIFTFACPQPGWWGFAALNTADFTLPDPDGNQKPVELGGVLWIYMDEYSK